MRSPQVRRDERPWTVYLLTAVGGVSTLSILVFTGSRGPWDVVALLFGSGLTYALWVGKQWAFTLMFMFASLCMGIAVTVALVQVLLLEQNVSRELWPALVGSAFWIALLVYPATKRFAGMDVWSDHTGELTAS